MAMITNEREDYSAIVKLCYKGLSESFIEPFKDSLCLPSLVEQNAKTIPLFRSLFTISPFLDKFAKIFAKGPSKGIFAGKKDAADTAKLPTYISAYGTALHKRGQKFAKLDVKTQLDLYSQIVHQDDTLLAQLHVIAWLEDIYEIPNLRARNIVDFKEMTNTVLRKGSVKPISLDPDSISASAQELRNSTECSTEWKNYKDLMLHIFYLIRKGKLAEAETCLMESGQVLTSY